MHTTEQLAGWMRRSPEQPLRRFDLSPGPVTILPNTDVVISPDGSMLAVTGRVGTEDAIYLRHLDGDPEFHKLAGTESGLRTGIFIPMAGGSSSRSRQPSLPRVPMRHRGRVISS